MEALGEGLAALAFWGFIAALCVAGVWGDASKRESQHETLRRMLESNKPIDEALLTKLMGVEPRRPDRDLNVAAIIAVSIAVGLAVLAAALSDMAPQALMPLLGSAGVCVCIAAGLKFAAAYVRRSNLEDEARARRQG
jgi:hypothetical protein